MGRVAIQALQIFFSFSNMKYRLTNPKQGHEQIQQVWQECKTVLENGQELTVSVKPVTRSEEQSALYHKLIDQIAAQANHAGSNWDALSWKRLLMNKFAKDVPEAELAHGSLIPNLEYNGVVEVNVLTRDLTVKQAGMFIDWLGAWCAENGVTLSE